MSQLSERIRAVASPHPPYQIRYGDVKLHKTLEELAACWLTQVVNHPPVINHESLVQPGGTFHTTASLISEPETGFFLFSQYLINKS